MPQTNSSIDWTTANWITRSATDDPRLPVFRKRFAIGAGVARATLHCCGLGQFEASINGAKVGDDVLEPGWTDYHKTCLFTSHDVATLLKPGDNELRIMLGNGMYHVAGPRYRKFNGSFGPLRFIAQVHIEFTDGKSSIIPSDDSWESSPGPVTFSSIYGGEDYDARLESDLHWQRAVVTDSPGGALLPQTIPPVRVMQCFDPIKITQPQPDAQVYDLGQNFSGWPQISVSGEAGASVTLTTGELLDRDSGLVSQRSSGSPVTFTYTLRGGGAEEVWHPRFTYTGFRYVQVQTQGPVGVLGVKGQFIHSSARAVGSFACSSDLFNRIHNLILAAVRSNMQSLFTDCPHREKLGWLEQVHLMGESILFNFDAATLLQKMYRDMRDAQHTDGCVPTIAPQYTVFDTKWGPFNDSPEWGSAIVISPWQLYCRCGDVRVLADNYDAMSRYVAYLGSRAVDDILDYGLGDWYDIGPGDPGFPKLTSKSLTATAIYYADLCVMASAARVLHKDDDARKYDALAARVRDSFNAKLWDAKNSRYDTGSQTACAMPLALGLVPDDRRAAVLDALVRDIRAHDNHITAGDIGFDFVVRALAENGRSDVVFDPLSRTDAPSYGAQLAAGATALTEAWDANPTKSQNHFMLGHAESWFYKYLAGIDLDLSREASTKLHIHPAMVGDLLWAKASYDSPAGAIAVHWTRDPESGAWAISLSVPEGLHARVVLPTGDASKVKLAGGAAPTDAPNTYMVPPGEHRFERIGTADGRR